MQQNPNSSLPIPVEPEITEPFSQPAGWPVQAMPAQLQQVPPLDSYSSVCVRVREASIIASNDPVACNHGGALPPSAPPLKAAAGRKRFSPALVAAWLCVAQLAIIITLLAGQSWHIDKAVGVLQRSICSIAAPKLQAFLKAGDAAFSDEPEVTGTSPAAGNKKKHSHSAKNKKSLPGIQFSWPTAKNFVPPPPPSMPTEKLLVPPPPVAFSLPGPGAVAASTLPPVAASTEPVKKAPAQKEKKHAIEPSNSEPVAPAPAINESNADSTTIPGEAPPFFGSEANEPLILPRPAPAVVSAPPAASPAAPPPAVMQPTAAMQQTPAQAPVPGIRTVITGNRKRIIVDR